MKKNYIFTLFLAICFSTLSFGQGSEVFTNSTATSSYGDASFVGEGGVTWTFVASRQASGNFSDDITTMNLPALLLRRTADDSKITSSTISGGLADFSVKLYKGFTGGGDRQVELFVNGVSKGTSEVFDDYTEHVFAVTGVNIAGDVVIEIKNTTGKQVIIDEVTWTAYEATSGSTNPLEGSWSFTPEAGSMGVGPNPGDYSWWSIPEADVTTRSCIFDDEYVFNADGSFTNVQGTDTWTETWQTGVTVEGCGAAVAPHDGSNAATYTVDATAGTVTIVGSGAYLGLSKVTNQAEN